MVVAARARDREAEERAPRDIDRAGDAVGLVVAHIDGRMRRGTEEPPRGAERRGVRQSHARARRKHVARDLLRHEARGRDVGVERVDHVVAVAPRLGDRVVELMRERLGVAREVEPVTPPPLAVRGARKRAVDERRKVRVARIGGERAHIGLARRKARDVERRATQERRRRRVARGRGKAGVLARRKREAIDVAAAPCGVAHGRHRGIREPAERPRRGVLRAFADPRAQCGDFLRRERLAAVGRHALVGIGVRHAREDDALIRLARDDRVDDGVLIVALQRRGRAREGVEPEPRLARLGVRTVAREALRGEHGTHLAVEINCGTRVRAGKQRERSDDGRTTE